MRYFIIIIFLLASVYLTALPKPIEDADYIALAKEKTEVAEISLKKTVSGRIAELHDKNNKLTGYYALSREFGKVNGYNGPTKLGVLLAPDMSISRIDMISSPDTKSFVNRILKANFLDQFKGKKCINDKDFKTITAATITCDAWIKTVQMVLEGVKEEE
ncbi:MAG: FMN-binding protein [Candidatus Cloacimonetes bacterium]|nr:FMN-binding protein [Candidatus Cloacimonadota bacterium]